MHRQSYTTCIVLCRRRFVIQYSYFSGQTYLTNVKKSITRQPTRLTSVVRFFGFPRSGSMKNCCATFEERNKKSSIGVINDMVEMSNFNQSMSGRQNSVTSVIEKVLSIFRIGVFIFYASFAAAQDFNAGRDAYINGAYTIAFEQWLPLAEQGDAVSQFNLGVLYLTGRGVGRDPSKAAQWYLRAAEQGEVNAQFNLALMLEQGIDISQDLTKAVYWYRMAAEQGDTAAQFNLGVMHDRGLGVQQNAFEAMRWYRRAADQGDARAAFNLGSLYAAGDTQVPDNAETALWLRKAAELGNAQAGFSLGVRYANGRGVPQDEVQAVRWYRMAARQGEARAAGNLGVMYADGRGVKQDSVLAHMWLIIASENGSETARRNRTKFEAVLLSSDIREAQALALACIAKNYIGCD